MRLRIFLILLLAVAFSSNVSAVEWDLMADFEGGNNYPNDLEYIQAQCTGSDDECPGGEASGYEADICGLRFDNIVSSQNLPDQPGQELAFAQSPMLDRPINVPEKAHCITKPEMRLFKNGNLVKEETINYEPKGDMNPNVGEYLHAVAAIKPDSCTFSFQSDCEKREVLHHFFLTDHKHPQWTGEGAFNTEPNHYEGGNNILVKNTAGLGSNLAGYTAGMGNITDQSLGDIKWGEINLYCATETPQACSVWAHPFVTSNKYQPGNLLSDAQSMSPIHDYGNFAPSGEIIFGNYPQYYVDDSGGREEAAKSQNTEKFFVCREGATMFNGYSSEVPQVVEAKGELYQCDQGEGNWDSVSQCNDGLDNDGDGGIDHPDAEISTSVGRDNQCGSQTDTSGEGSTLGCTPVVTKTESSELVAYYGGNTLEGSNYCDGSNGNRETFSEWTSSLEGVSSGNVPEPEVVTCSEFEDQNLNQEDSAYCEDRNYDNHDDDSSEPNSQVNFVKYYPTSTYFDEIITESLPNTYDPATTHFVDQNGFTEARMALDNSGASGDGGKPANRKGAENIYGSDTLGPHSDAYWLETLGMVDEDGNGYTAGSYNDSWVVANAGAPDNPRVSTQFPGGYAGKCPEGTRWKFLQTEDRWQCSGQPDWKQAVFLPKIAPGSDTIGMFVMPYNFRGVNTDANLDLRQNLRLTSWMTAYNEEADQQADSNQILDTMKVSCFPGETTPDYSSATEGTDYFNRTLDIPGTNIDNPIGVYGEVDMGGLENQEYTCNWNYTTQNGELATDVGRVIQLQKSTSDVVNNFGRIKSNYTGEYAKEFASGYKFERKDYTRYDITKLVDRFKQREDWTVS